MDLVHRAIQPFGQLSKLSAEGALALSGRRMTYDMAAPGTPKGRLTEA